METILSLVKKILDMGWAIDIRSDVSEKVFLLSKKTDTFTVTMFVSKIL